MPIKYITCDCVNNEESIKDCPICKGKGIITLYQNTKPPVYNFGNIIKNLLTTCENNGV